MQRISWSAGLILGLSGVIAGCDRATRDEVQSTPAKPPIVARFDCDSLALTASFHEDRVVLELPPDRTITLPQTVSASGARYSDETTTFWNKGREARFEIDGRTETCRERRDPWQEARDRGVEFRALGQEPGWFLEIDREKQMRLVYDYAEREAITPVPAPAVDGRTTVYEASTPDHRLRVVIEDAACSDVMSGEAFTQTVTVEIDGRMLHGCGRQL